MEDLNSLFHIARLIAKEREGDITSEEKQEIETWLKHDSGNNKIYTQLKEGDEIYESLYMLENIDTKKPFRKIWNKIRKINNEDKPIFVVPKVIKYAAAILLVMAGTITIYFTMNKINRQSRQFAELEPGIPKAILITADNQQIALGSTNVKYLFRNRKLSVIDTAQTLTYEIVGPDSEKVEEVEYNQIVVPRGGEYSLILADGSKIKLNADSRLRFPVTFSGSIREVELEGEAYFEVQKSEKIPFVVHTKDMLIRVYGTSFNVSAYENENIAHTTLVEGIVGIELTSGNNRREVRLDPGKQVIYNRETSKIELHEVDTELYTAWINGVFVFENENVESIMKKLSRWYDFEIHFSAEELKSRSFTGDLKRYDNILTILNMMSIASDLEFKIDGRTVIVSKTK